MSAARPSARARRRSAPSARQARQAPIPAAREWEPTAARIAQAQRRSPLVQPRQRRTVDRSLRRRLARAAVARSTREAPGGVAAQVEEGAAVRAAAREGVAAEPAVESAPLSHCAIAQPRPEIASAAAATAAAVMAGTPAGTNSGGRRRLAVQRLAHNTHWRTPRARAACAPPRDATNRSSRWRARARTRARHATSARWIAARAAAARPAAPPQPPPAA
eukprot:scaffold16870_cov59-Isochrysis_galbana.AAC.1